MIYILEFKLKSFSTQMVQYNHKLTMYSVKSALQSIQICAWTQEMKDLYEMDHIATLIMAKLATPIMAPIAT